MSSSRYTALALLTRYCSLLMSFLNISSGLLLASVFFFQLSGLFIELLSLPVSSGTYLSMHMVITYVCYFSITS